MAAVLAAAALGAAGTQAPAHATTAAVGGRASASTGSSKGATVVPLCATAKKGQFRCFALKRTDLPGAKGLQPLATPAGYGPTDLASAYGLPSGGGAGTTVALVDANDDPSAEADLGVYRAQYGLPACTTANGCFSKVDQTGGTNYPPADANWSGEISLDLDMVSAIAPAAHIILVEANTPNFTDLGAAVDEAVALGAGFVSNSYGSQYSSTPGSGEDPSETTTMDPYYNHPGVAIVASSGDSGYGVAYPAASQYVTSVGGTSLVRDSSTRGWSESVWNDSFGGGGSGCSLYEPKPSFQTDSGCSMRTVADVSAVADPATGVAVYDSFQSAGWQVFGGTSAASPIIASVYADAGNPAAGTYPNSYPYARASAFNDVTTGSNGTCTPTYLCTAGPGYDGPTGLGTPQGTSGFASGPHGLVTGTVTASGGGALADAKVTVGSTSIVTGANGTYSVSVPAGTYTVSASAYGYATQTVTGVAVADGASVTENFSLAAVARATVSGKVTDGSGKGWPLYASISVEGAPGGPVYTNPKTGAYSLQLPVDGTYTLDVTPAYTGYQEAKQQVTVGISNVTQNIAVLVDATACTAPGYATHVHGSSQTFDTTSLPAGWTITNATATVGGWEFDDPGNRGNLTGGTGGFAIVDSDHLGIGNHQDSILTGPVTDLSAITDPSLSFDTYYKAFSNSTAEVDVSTDGGTTWTSVWQYSTTNVNGQHVSIPLPQAVGKTAVQVQFHYTGTWAYYWEVDDVVLGDTTCDPVPGGLVVGQVTDANTKTALAGAVITEAGTTPVTTTSAATTDPALKGAFYWLFSPGTGAQSLTAAMTHYTSATAAVTVPASGVVEQDFSLKAGRLTVTPSSISKTIAWGGNTTATLTAKNTGTAPATLSLGNLNGGFTIQGVKLSGAPVQHVTGTFPTTDMVIAKKQAVGKAGVTPSAVGQTAGTAWQSIANFPTTIQDNLAEYNGGKLYSGFGFTGAADTNALYSFDPGAGTWTQLASATDTRETPAHGFIDGKLYVAGGWGASGSPDTSTEVYDPAANTWSQGPAWAGAMAGSGSAVLGTKLYVVGGCGASTCGSTSVSVLDTTSGSWSTAANYPETTSWLACGAIAGKIYCAGGTDGTATSAHTYVYDPSFDSWTKLTDMPTGAWGGAYTAANGLLLVQDGVAGGALTNQGWAYNPTTDTWSALPNANAAAYRFGGALGFYMVGGGEGTFATPLNTAAVLPGYDQGSNAGAPWLSLSANSVTLAPGATATVTVTLNAADPSIVQPGAYTASLLLDSDTPYRLGAVPVTMTVKPPSTWGKITGVVQYTDTSGKLVPIAGATVQIDTWATHYTLHTDASGGYALWLDYRNNPLTVIAAKDGYQPQVATVKIKKGNTVTQSFTLLID
ncbi:carboxypeptidase regulatory-like domain-containing protein [Actinocrinis sp.]|uniref:carboxypeptidase regulatory-like domain-containing protein n=1 Tax=Actinocrinis sp. TaxID=1920516 RepID=UPI003BB8755E